MRLSRPYSAGKEPSSTIQSPFIDHLMKLECSSMKQRLAAVIMPIVLLHVAGTAFSAVFLSQIQEDLLEVRSYYGNGVKQIILVTGDAFALPTRDLKGIGKLIASIFPRIDTISMYASIRNIKDKTDEELLALRALKLNDFNIGVDSGSEAALAFFDEGFPLHEAKEQLLRLKRLGCCYSINLMLGAGDRGKGLESARANALLANLVQSQLIFGSPLHVDRGSALGRLIQA